MRPPFRDLDHEHLFAAVDHQIVDHPKRVVLVFLVLTTIFVGGFAGVEIDAGTERFFDSVPEHHTQTYVDEQFGSTFAAEDDSTQIVVTGENVLSKRSLLRMIELTEELESNPSYRVREVTGIAPGVAQILDPFATSTSAQKQAIETATPAEIHEATRTLAAQRPQISQLLSEDQNLGEPYASATILIVSHTVPEGDESTLESIQNRMKDVIETGPGDIRVFGTAIQQEGFDRAIFESLSLIIPMVTVLILAFLVIAYRDPIDLILALLSLIFAIVWTFGFMGYLGIRFNLMMVAVPVLLLGVGIDFGIHAVNRYREERIEGTAAKTSMSVANSQLLVAFFIVSITNVIGFSANVTSKLEPVREFGLVVATGMVFTLFVFGVFLPALKLIVDRQRERLGVRQFSITPLGGEESRLGDVLRMSATVTKEHPFLLLALILVITGGAANSATNVESKFETEDFLPYADHPAQLELVPDEISPSEYEITDTSNYIKESFTTTNTEQVTMYIEAPLQRNHALETIARIDRDPPPSFVRKEGAAVSQGITGVIQSYAQEDPEFAALVNRNDLSENGVPDRHLTPIYNSLLTSEYDDQARAYLTEDRRATKVIYQVKASASQKEVAEDARTLAGDARFETVATGDIIVFRALTEALMTSALRSFAVAYSLTALFLMFIFGVLEGRWSLGFVAMTPVTVAIILLVGAMPVLGITFNALTATILAITIGLGVAYSVHVTHRFIDEYDQLGDVYKSLRVTLSGTGGGITASMLTTSGSVFCMAFAVNPILGQFGILTGVSTLFSYLTAVTVLPLALYWWATIEWQRIGPNLAQKTPEVFG